MAANLVGMAFIPYYRHIVDLLDTNQELKKTAHGIFHQVAYAAGGTAIGGIVAGPPGALIGSYLGYRTVNDYDSMVEVIRGLSDAEKADLVRKVQALVGSTSLEALTGFIGQQVNREIFVNLVREFANHANKSGG
ncbi:hypothetical protein LSH36_593g01027 [Paralvinella palmiformis]|uniref:Uncharacterized protein n=1 Tax=Paralvinella palmiformis TaxID=53620 RepID=A0AAD9J691_9ANNE|nr:hypothetical protein LSH36_593g01027 [Paralvinella palmiformis]